MAEAAHADDAHGDYARGHMDIQEQKGTFDGFIEATVWGCAHIAQYVALFTLAFAIGAGWWAGMAAFLVIGIGAGVLFKQGGGWWAFLIAQVVLLGIGGLIVPLIAGLAA